MIGVGQRSEDGLRFHVGFPSGCFLFFEQVRSQDLHVGRGFFFMGGSCVKGHHPGKFQDGSVHLNRGRDKRHGPQA